MHFFLDDPTLKSIDKADWNLKHRTLADFELVNGCLHRKADNVYQSPRYYVSENEGFGYIVREHVRLEHPGQDRTRLAVDVRYYGIDKLEVGWVCAHCWYCKLNRRSAVKAPLEPIIVNRMFERLQIDLIDMRYEPSGTYA